MLDDPALRADSLTFCTLPLDDGEGSAEVISFVFLMPFLMAAIALFGAAAKDSFVRGGGFGAHRRLAAALVCFLPEMPRARDLLELTGEEADV